MSERRYTVTKDQIMILKNLGGETFNDYLTTLTPDPEPSGEVDVKEIDDKVICFVDGLTERQDINPMLVGLWYAKVQAFVTAEVTRQVEERTRVYREALESARSTVGLAYHSAEKQFNDETLLHLGICGARIDKALANKGEE